jgi:transcriptional regulator with XRE-family HTH domain
MPMPINLTDLGRRARAIRIARGLTLDDVVSRAEFTVSWLSKLENGLLSPSLEGLVKLSDVLECGVEELVEGLSVRPRHVVVRKGEGRVDNSRDRAGDTRLEQLAATWRGRGMNPVILYLAPSPHSGVRPPATSLVGERFLHVIAGDVKLQYGQELIDLGEGDSVYLDATIPHNLTTSGRSKAKVLSVSFEPLRTGVRTASGKTARRPPSGRGSRKSSSP